MNPLVQTIAQTLKARGVKAKSTSQRDLNFIGKSADPFSVLAAKALIRIYNGDPDFAGIGDVYYSVEYQEPGSDTKYYEDVYGRNDWTKGAQDPNTKTSLEQASGDVDGSAGADLTEGTLLAVLGTTGAVSNVRNVIEKGRILSLSQSLEGVIVDDDTTGVRGVDDVDAELELFA